MADISRPLITRVGGTRGHFRACYYGRLNCHLVVSFYNISASLPVLENFWAFSLITSHYGLLFRLHGENPAKWPTIHSLPGIDMLSFSQILSVGNENHSSCRLDNVLRFSTFLSRFLHESIAQAHLQVQTSCVALGHLRTIMACFDNLCLASIATPGQIIHCLKATEITFKMLYNL